MLNSKSMTILAFTALGAGTASAADLARPYTKAAPVFAQSFYNWSGFYVGGHVGGAWTNQNWINTANTTLFGDLILARVSASVRRASSAAASSATTGRPATTCSDSKARSLA